MSLCAQQESVQQKLGGIIVETFKAFLSTAAGIIAIMGFIPYIWAVVRNETKPVKATWIIWAALDSITLLGMYYKGAANGQIMGAVLGASTVMILALIKGTPGWSKLDKQCLVGAVAGVLLWILFNEPNLGIIVSNLVIFIGGIPTFKAAWNNPDSEDKLAWTIFWISCVCATLGIPHWTPEDAVQPITFLVVETVMMFLIYIRPRMIASA